MHPAVKRPKEGGIDVPSNLQGIWNRDGNATRDAVWASDIHSNINVQMNYWPVESTNLSECHLPFLNYIYNETTRPGGTWQQNAHELGAREGWVVNTAGNIFGGSSNYKRGLRIDHQGLIREWKYRENTPNIPAPENYFADDETNVWKGHRHTSHLMALYPGFHIDPGADTALFRAAVATLDDRGDISTGWARAWRICLRARTRDAEQTYRTLRGFAHHTTAQHYDWQGGLYDNLLDAHATSVFQIEGNFGATAGIAEMLLQSRPDSLVLLPALPAAWAEGQVRGLKAIGNFEVDLSWSAGRLHTLRVRSLSGRPLTLALPGIERATIRAKRGKRPRPDRTTPGRLSFPTHPGAVYTITLPGGI